MNEKEQRTGSGIGITQEVLIHPTQDCHPERSPAEQDGVEGPAVAFRDLRVPAGPSLLGTGEPTRPRRHPARRLRRHRPPAHSRQLLRPRLRRASRLLARFAQRVASRHSLSPLDAQPQLRRWRASLRLLSPAHLDARRGARRYPSLESRAHRAHLSHPRRNRPRHARPRARSIRFKRLGPEALDLDALDSLPAALAGCVSIFSGYTLFTGYERCAFPEFAGGFWLPLIILFALRDRGRVPHVPRIWGHGSDPESNRVPHVPRRESRLPRRASLATRAFDGSTVPLALALAGAWLSNLPLGVIAGYLLAGVALTWAIVNKTWAPLLRAAVATVLGLGLAAIYWLPAALERHWVDIRQATEDPGYNFENNWLFARNANPLLALHDVILRQVSWIAVSMIAVALASVLVCYLRNSLPGPEKIPLAAFPSSFCSSSFPSRGPSGICCLKCPSCNIPGAGLKPLKRPCPSSSSPPSGPPAAACPVPRIWGHGSDPNSATPAAPASPESSPSSPAHALMPQPSTPEPLSSRSATPRHGRIHANQLSRPARALKACTSTSRPAATTPASPPAFPTPAS
jgi:hypothetical protein